MSNSKPMHPSVVHTFSADPGIALVCPVCRTLLHREHARLVCLGSECRKAFPIRDGIPLLLDSEAETLSTSDWNSLHNQ